MVPLVQCLVAHHPLLHDFPSRLVASVWRAHNHTERFAPRRLATAAGDDPQCPTGRARGAGSRAAPRYSTAAGVAALNGRSGASGWQLRIFAARGIEL